MLNRHRPEYRIWSNIVQRCCNPNNPAYGRYGGRGIMICPEWRGSFAAFFQHAAERALSAPQVGRINSSRRLSDDQVIEMRRRAALGETGKDLACEFGVAHSTACRVIAGKHFRAIASARATEERP